MNSRFLQGDRVRLAAYDPKADAGLIAEWSQDSEYMRLLDAEPARPMDLRRARLDMEKKEARENDLSFIIRTLDPDRAIGFVELDGVQRESGNAWVGIGIGNREYWGKGYGTDALRVLLRYAFAELNLHRISLDVFEYNVRALRCYEKAGFTIEGRTRNCLHRDGRRWDLIYMGILRDEWEKQQREHQV
jgi:RimJ/RimL family protein N-acetyltransferase